MAITKLGQEYIDKTANVPLIGFLGKVLKSPITAGKLIRKIPGIKPIAKGAYKATAGVATTALKGADKLGRFTATKPGIAIPTLAMTGIGAYTINDKIKRNMLHTDPRVNLTIVGSDPKARFKLINPKARVGIRYKDPRIKEMYRKYNPYF